MDLQENSAQTSFISLEIRRQLEELGFRFATTPEDGVIWGFDGSTKYFPRETYVREGENGRPGMKVRLEKTVNGINLIVNSDPFDIRHHIDKYQITPQEIIATVKSKISSF